MGSPEGYQGSDTCQVLKLLSKSHLTPHPFILPEGQDFLTTASSPHPWGGECPASLLAPSTQVPVCWGFCFGWKEEAEVSACLALSSILLPPPSLPPCSQDVSSTGLAPLQPLPPPGPAACVLVLPPIQFIFLLGTSAACGFPAWALNAFDPWGGSAGYVLQGGACCLFKSLSRRACCSALGSSFAHLSTSFQGKVGLGLGLVGLSGGLSCCTHSFVC